MTVSSGSYSVGTGGDYITWYAAMQDVDKTALSGNLTFTQVSDVIETQLPPLVQTATNSYKLLLTSDNPHYGDPIKGWWTTYNIGGGPLLLFGGTGGGNIEVKNLRIKTLVNFTSCLTAYSGDCDYSFHDLILDINGVNGNAFEINTTSNCYCYNAYINRATNGLYWLNSSSSSAFSNITTYNCGTGFYGGNFIIKNCAAFNSSVKDFGIMTGTFTRCASSDLSGSVAALRNLTAAAQFRSVNITESDFLDLLPTGALWQSGTAFKQNGQRKDIRDRKLPNNRGKYSVGASTAWDNQILEVLNDLASPTTTSTPAPATGPRLVTVDRGTATRSLYNTLYDYQAPWWLLNK